MVYLRFVRKGGEGKVNKSPTAQVQAQKRDVLKRKRCGLLDAKNQKKKRRGPEDAWGSGGRSQLRAWELGGYLEGQWEECNQLNWGDTTGDPIEKIEGRGKRLA